MRVRISIKCPSDFENNRIGVIKEFRQITSCDLKEAVDFVNLYEGSKEIDLITCNMFNLRFWNVEIVPTSSFVTQETSVDRFKTLVKDLVDEGQYELAKDLLHLLKVHKL